MKIAILAQFSSKFSAIFPKKNVQFLPQFSVGLTYRLPQTCRSACLTPASVLHHLNILYHDCQRCQLHLFSTAQPCQDGGTLVFVSSPSTSDTDRSGTRRQHRCVAVIRCLWPRGLCWRWRHHERARHYNRQGLFCSTAADTKRATCGIHWRMTPYWRWSGHWS